MPYKFIFFITIAILAIGSAGCGGSTANTNTSVANSNSAAANANGPLSTTKKPESETTNNAPTISPVVTAYYEALKRKDDAELKNVLSNDYLRSIQEDMRADHKSGSIAAYLAESEPAGDTLPEARNEKITGEKAIAEVRGGTLKVWTPFEFINEGGKWKYTGQSPDLRSVQKTETGSNSTK